MPCFPGNLRQADGLSSPLRPEIPITGDGPHDNGRSIAPGPARAAPLDLLLGQQIIGVGLDEQLHEHRMHDAPPPGALGGARCMPCPSPSRGPRTTVDTFRKHCHAAARRWSTCLPGCQWRVHGRRRGWLRCPAADEFASRRQGGVLAASGVVIADDGHLLDIRGEQVKSPGLRIRAQRCATATATA